MKLVVEREWIFKLFQGKKKSDLILKSKSITYIEFILVFKSSHSYKSASSLVLKSKYSHFSSDFL